MLRNISSFYVRLFFRIQMILRVISLKCHATSPAHTYLHCKVRAQHITRLAAACLVMFATFVFRYSTRNDVELLVSIELPK